MPTTYYLWIDGQPEPVVFEADLAQASAQIGNSPYTSDDALHEPALMGLLYLEWFQPDRLRESCWNRARLTDEHGHEWEVEVVDSPGAVFDVHPAIPGLRFRRATGEVSHWNDEWHTWFPGWGPHRAVAAGLWWPPCADWSARLTLTAAAAAQEPLMIRVAAKEPR